MSINIGERRKTNIKNDSFLLNSSKSVQALKNGANLGNKINVGQNLAFDNPTIANQNKQTPFNNNPTIFQEVPSSSYGCQVNKKPLNHQKLQQTLQRHSQLKKKYETLLSCKPKSKVLQINKQSSPPATAQQQVKFLSYNEINESQYAHIPFKETTSGIIIPEQNNKQNPSFISIFNGLCLQQFQVVKYFGNGISGKVFLAQNLKNKSTFSIKVIKKSQLTQTNFNQLIREIKIQSYLNHPNIVKLYHNFVDKESVYLFLEPCLDGNLYQSMKLKQGKFTEKQAREIIKQICNAVQYMHKNDIIHRDLKPENILLHQGVIKICDFGWAVYSPLLRDTRCGTPLYASPEMIKRQLYDSKIDIWNIGILTYQILFGNIPFQIKQVDDINKIIDEEIFFPQQMHISESAKSFILGCLHKNPLKRYSIMQAIEHDFLKGSEKFRMTIC